VNSVLFAFLSVGSGYSFKKPFAPKTQSVCTLMKVYQHRNDKIKRSMLDQDIREKHYCW